jgi:hypothetical protein
MWSIASLAAFTLLTFELHAAEDAPHNWPMLCSPLSLDDFDSEKLRDASLRVSESESTMSSRICLLWFRFIERNGSGTDPRTRRCLSSIHDSDKKALTSGRSHSPTRGCPPKNMMVLIPYCFIIQGPKAMQRRRLSKQVRSRVLAELEPFRRLLLLVLACF